MSKKKPKSRKPHRTGWLQNPMVTRPGEKVGGGFFIFRRGVETGRIRPSWWPFEYPSREAAAAQMEKLVQENPGQFFIMVQAVDGAYSPPVETPVAEEEAVAA